MVKMEFRYSLLITFVLFSLSNCQFEDMRDRFRAKKYCGDNLSNMLSDICRGNYNTLHKNNDRSRDDLYLSDDPSISRETAYSILSRNGRRKKRGVYNECCEKSCSREELASYCGAFGSLPLR